MTANSRRWTGLLSTLAPTSRSTVRPWRLGSTAASAGRSTPETVPITILAAIMAAPVLPAVTMAWARPSWTSSAQMRREERRFLRIGVMAGSSMPTTSSAWTISMRPSGDPRRRSSASTRARSPTRRIEEPSSRAARKAPSTALCGAKSPPMASTAIGMMGRFRQITWPLTPQPLSPSPPPSLTGREGLRTLTGRAGGGTAEEGRAHWGSNEGQRTGDADSDYLEILFPLDHLPAAVLPAVGAGAVGQLDLAAVGAGRGGGARQRVVRAALVAAGLGVASFRIRHGRRASSGLQVLEFGHFVSCSRLFSAARDSQRG